MPDPKADPKKVNRDDYVWCDPCGGYVLKKLLRAGGDDDSIFDDGPKGTTCPAGHPVTA